MSKQFSVKIDGKVFESDEDGRLDLNIIWRDFNLPNKNRPSQWRGKIVDQLKHCANLQTARKSTSYNEHTVLVADERAAIAYAMWVNFEFYCSVLDAFVALRNGEIQKAVGLASNTLSDADAHYLKRQQRLKGMLWDDACAYAGIYHPQKCREMLINHPKFTYFHKEGKFYIASEVGEDIGFFYNRGNKFSSKTTLQVTSDGREWLKENRGWFNRNS